MSILSKLYPFDLPSHTSLILRAEMETVLAVSDINFDPALVTDISQLSAEEFLLYVRYEANQCPGVVRAHVDSDQFKGCQTEYMPKVVDIPTCHDMFLPSSEWENEVVDAFSRFRLVTKCHYDDDLMTCVLCSA